MPVEVAAPYREAVAPTASIAATFQQVRGATQMVHAACSAPLKIAKTFPLRGGQLGVCVIDCSPGLLAGDCYEIDWQLETGTQVFLTNQSFTRVHPSRDDPTHQRQRIVVGENACLEYLPEPVMLFRDAAFRAACDIELATGSTLLMSDILCAGRTRRDEAFQFHRYDSRLRVRSNGELIYANQVRYWPAEREPCTVGAWDGYTHAGTLLYFNVRISPSAWDGVTQRLRDVTAQHHAVMSGVSLAYRHGVVVSMLGHRAWDLQQLVAQLREVVLDAAAVPYPAGRDT